MDTEWTRRWDVVVVDGGMMMMGGGGGKKVPQVFLVVRATSQETRS